MLGWPLPGTDAQGDRSPEPRGHGEKRRRDERDVVRAAVGSKKWILPSLTGSRRRIESVRTPFGKVAFHPAPSGDYSARGPSPQPAPCATPDSPRAISDRTESSVRKICVLDQNARARADLYQVGFRSSVRHHRIAADPSHQQAHPRSNQQDVHGLPELAVGQASEEAQSAGRANQRCRDVGQLRQVRQ
jgi:hypothetical protein